MLAEPKSSPWGEVDYCDVLCPGVFLISATESGGTMVAKDIAEFMSPAARKQGQPRSGYLCYGEVTEEAIIFRELLDKRLWDIPARVRDRAAFEENINQTIRENHPEYWRSREQGRMNVPPAKPVPEHIER